MTRAPSAVVFDLGKVLLDFDYGLVVNRVAARSSATAEQLQQLFTASDLLPAYERGELSSAAFFDAVRRETGFTGSFDEFADFFGDIFTEITPMTGIHAELRARGVPTFIFSNTNDLAIRHIRARFPFFAEFDGYVLSYEHGVMKPDAPLYEQVEALTRRQGSDLLYFDDRPENIATARARGWQAHIHTDPAGSIAQVRAAGLLG